MPTTSPPQHPTRSAAELPERRHSNNVSGLESDFAETVDRLLQKMLLQACERLAYLSLFERALEVLPSTLKTRTRNAILGILHVWLGSSDILRIDRTRVMLDALARLSGSTESIPKNGSHLIDYVLSDAVLPPTHAAADSHFLLRAGTLLTAFASSLEKIDSAALLWARLAACALVESSEPEAILLLVAGTRRKASDGVGDLEGFRYFACARALRVVTLRTAQRLIPDLLKTNLGLRSDLKSETPEFTTEALYAKLSCAGLFSTPFKAARWQPDGRLEEERVWEITASVGRRLTFFWSQTQKALLRRSAFDFLDLRLDASLTTQVPSKSSDFGFTFLPVMHGIVAVAGLSTWALAVLSETLRRIDEEVAGNTSLSTFYGIALSLAHRRRIAFDQKRFGFSTINAAEAPHARVLARLQRLTVAYEVAREHTDTDSARAGAASLMPDDAALESRLVPPGGLFIPKEAFSVPCFLWITPLEALGLAATLDLNGKVPSRFRPGARNRLEGVVLAFFLSRANARTWLADLVGSSSTSRIRLLARFLRLDAMTRTLGLLVEECENTQKSLSAELLQRSSSLGETIKSAQSQALEKFLSPADIRSVRRASMGEMVHGFLSHRHYLTEGFASPSGLEAVLKAHKQHQIQYNSRRIRRLRAAMRSVSASQESSDPSV